MAKRKADVVGKHCTEDNINKEEKAKLDVRSAYGTLRTTLLLTFKVLNVDGSISVKHYFWYK